MNGEIGTLFQEGKQIGGFYDWAIDIQLLKGLQNNKAIVKATAARFWVLCSPSQSEIRASFYRLVGDRLVLMNQAQVTVSLGDKLGLIKKPLEMIWTK